MFVCVVTNTKNHFKHSYYCTLLYTAASAYLNRPEVMEAIHVKDPEGCWSVCSQHQGWTYKSTRPNLPRDTYPLLIKNINVLTVVHITLLQFQVRFGFHDQQKNQNKNGNYF